MHNKSLLAALVLGLAGSTAAWAGDAGTVYGALGSNGLGVGYARSVSESWAVRGQYNYYQRSISADVGDFGSAAVVDMKLKLQSLQLMGDWYLGQGGFRLSGGVVFNNNRIALEATNATVGTATNQTASAEIRMSKSPSPYIGLGYSSRPANAKGFGFLFDAGVMYQNPDVTLTASGASQADIDAQKAKVQDAVDKLRVMPVVTVALSYSF